MSSPCIPQTRDFAVPMNQLPLKVADPDLVQINLATQNLKAGGPETISLIVTPAPLARAQVQIWSAGTKPPPAINTPTNWTVANMPASVYVEGLLEGAAFREITLTLQITNNGTVVAKDTCALTVTPVLWNFLVTVSANGAGNDAAPDKFLNPALGWLLDSKGGLAVGIDAFTGDVSAQWNGVRGNLRFIQNVNNSNNLAGGTGADLGPRTWDFAKPGQTLVDSVWGAIPFVPDNLQLPANLMATNSMNDSPNLPLTAGPINPKTGKNIFLNSVLPAPVSRPTLT